MDARDLWQKNIVPAFQWTVNALGDAGNLLKQVSLECAHFPEEILLIFLFEIGGFSLLDPAVLGLPGDPAAAKNYLIKHLIMTNL